MELMSISLDKMYKFVFERQHETIPDEILGKITVTVTRNFSISVVSHSNCSHTDMTWVYVVMALLV